MAAFARDPVDYLADKGDLPPLQPGDRLSRVAFEQMYAASPLIKKAELIEGIVYMPSPTRYAQHGKPHFLLISWVGQYVAATPGIDGSDNSTVRLDNENVVQPDILLRLAPELGGGSSISADDYVEGSPELIVEIAASSVSYDLHQKRRVYARVGVPEYVVFLAFEQRIVWFILQDGRYVEMPPGKDCVLRSRTFPGLWLQSTAFLAGDLARMLSVLQEGLASEGHAEFVTRLSRSN